MLRKAHYITFLFKNTSVNDCLLVETGLLMSNTLVKLISICNIVIIITILGVFFQLFYVFHSLIHVGFVILYHLF